MEPRDDGINDDVKLDTLNRDIPDEPNAPSISEYIPFPEVTFSSEFLIQYTEWSALSQLWFYSCYS
ncbi:hypothetical protein SEUBUCD646_0A00800 [Saccharomyces eubayanus]|uniref:Uncharacterized protein n=1 Tax=Saccharomyces eubayanus TaxID=1080349 RepID=A0ABN8VUC7_SACEU|nr:hypothetical protein DI49_0064 [Saccharomyces eubayanus]KOH01396.1 hypothetical protein DI49_0064 [Saccharomyces eubayanus]CAI1796200.1 hypothetical protein SEUBUCD650_0A00790 [Saccharomyces eubayanus]CAI1833146.1 hypothetical protein SEUBUCD646_0A00800 [Saccharomyces eubayanus]